VSITGSERCVRSVASLGRSDMTFSTYNFDSVLVFVIAIVAGRAIYPFPAQY
jgi:hypothetical protein